MDVTGVGFVGTTPTGGLFWANCSGGLVGVTAAIITGSGGGAVGVATTGIKLRLPRITRLLALGLGPGNF